MKQNSANLKFVVTSKRNFRENYFLVKLFWSNSIQIRQKDLFLFNVMKKNVLRQKPGGCERFCYLNRPVFLFLKNNQKGYGNMEEEEI